MNSTFNKLFIVEVFVLKRNYNYKHLLTFNVPGNYYTNIKNDNKKKKKKSYNLNLQLSGKKIINIL